MCETFLKFYLGNKSVFLIYLFISLILPISLLRLCGLLHLLRFSQNQIVNFFPT